MHSPSILIFVIQLSSSLLFSSVFGQSYRNQFRSGSSTSTLKSTTTTAPTVLSKHSVFNASRQTLTPLENTLYDDDDDDDDKVDSLQNYDTHPSSLQSRQNPISMRRLWLWNHPLFEDHFNSLSNSSYKRNIQFPAKSRSWNRSRHTTNSIRRLGSSRTLQYIQSLHGGDIPTSTSSSSSSSQSLSSSTKSTKNRTRTKKKRSKKGSKKQISSTKQEDSNTVTVQTEGKQKMSDTMKVSDSAKSLGDAIRDRKDILQNDPILPPTMEVNDIDASLLSLGFSLGTSDPRSSSTKTTTTTDATSKTSSKTGTSRSRSNLDGGGVEASRASILANYFLQSHGGAYAFQCTVSAFSVITGLGALFLPLLSSFFFKQQQGASSSSFSIENLQLILLRRCLVCALLKHASGLLAAAILSARRIPDIGLYKTRKLMEELASDPVSQYLFYCALLMVWLPSSVSSSLSSSSSSSSSSSVGGATNVPPDGEGNMMDSSSSSSSPAAAAAAVSSSMGLPWYLNSKIQKPSMISFIGPILLREIIHLAWVIYDVCVILGTASSSSSSSSSSSTILSTFVKITQNGMDAFMSLLLTPKVWRNADSRKKQQLLAKLVSRISLLLEIGTGCILGMDMIGTFIRFSFSSLEMRPKTKDLLVKFACARLYLNYMLVRKTKIIKLLGTIRGGAGSVPGRIMDALLEPKVAMGIVDFDDDDEKGTSFDGENEGKHWIHHVSDALGI